MTLANVRLWGRQIGAIQWDAERSVGVFQYDPRFARSNIQVAPVMIPLAPDPWSFPSLRGTSFLGLPGLLADSLPDKFGNRLIDAWLTSQGRSPNSMNPVERLCYIGRRGMGALEFEPASGPTDGSSRHVDIEMLTSLANRVLDERAELSDLANPALNKRAELTSLANQARDERAKLSGRLQGEQDHDALQDILRVGTSAGGARAKALLAWNPATGEFRSGQIDELDGFEYWLLKFDGMHNNRDREVTDPLGYGLIEYAYARMAVAAGIDMAPCRLHHEGGRHHFMTRRFDRTETGKKLHMQSLAALRHFDYDDPASYSYEQAMETIRLISSAPAADLEQQFLRAAFNVIARNQDDHVKNIAFLMTPDGSWRLSPAYDITYAWNPQGKYTGRQQMSLNGKRDDFTADDIAALARTADIKPRRMRTLLEQIRDSVNRWTEFAREAGVESERAARIGRGHRVGF